MAKLPGFFFYCGDWLKDPALRRCSPAARGVWIDMLCLMFECEDRGVLSAGGVPWSDEEVAAAVSGDTTANLACICELIAKGVADRNSSGAIFSRRLVRDEGTRQGNKERKRNSRASEECHDNVTQPVTPLSEREIEAVDFDVGFDSFWKIYPKRIGKVSARRAWKKIRGAKEHVLEIIEGVEKWKASQQWQDAQFIPYPATFLNDRRWEAEVPQHGQQRSKTQQRSATNFEVLDRVRDAVDRGAGRALPSGIERAPGGALPKRAG